MPKQPIQDPNDTPEWWTRVTLGKVTQAVRCFDNGHPEAALDYLLAAHGRLDAAIGFYLTDWGQGRPAAYVPTAPLMVLLDPAASQAEVAEARRVILDAVRPRDRTP